jgi:polar amino acid transport system substrate-binding protein
MNATLCRLAAIVSLTMVLASTAAAQQNGPTLRVATFDLPPFVMERHGALTGFSIELWDAIAARMGAKSSYEKLPGVVQAFNALRSRDADVAVSGLFYSSERDREFDFSYPIMETGLRVMVPDTGKAASQNPLTSLLQLLFSRASLVWLGVAAALIVAAAHLLWLLERAQKDDTITGGTYFPGIFRAMYWAATTLLTQAEQAPRRSLARMLAVLWMFVGIVFVAFYTAQLTTSLTVEHLAGAIDGPDDLPGKRVATLQGGTSAAWLREQHAQVEEFAQNSEMYQALLDGRVDAVVQGSAGLAYYASHEGKGLVRLVGNEFNRNDVGFVFPLDSPLRKKVDGALLSLREDGTYQRIYDKWFGTP